MKKGSFLFGYSIISSHAENAERIINLCNERKIPFSEVVLEDESLRFSVPLFYEQRMRKAAREHEIEISVISRRGIPALFLRYRLRVGLLAGLICSILIFAFSSRLVWDIEIDGAVRLSERELLKTLADCGLSVGTRLRDVDADVLENQILILSDDISWISVNLSGNVACIEIRERDFPIPDEYGDALYSNVTASQSGVIVGFEDINGALDVKIGDAVSKDQLLISGILGGEGLPTRLTNAHGKVLAEVEDTVEIKIPKKYLKKVTHKEIKEEKSLIFFKNEIKFFSNCRNSPTICDKIDIMESFYTINQKKLPLAIKTVKYIEYENCEITRTREQMHDLAYIELYRYINEHYADAELLEKSISIDERDDETVLTCSIRCIKNIAQIKEIEVG